MTSPSPFPIAPNPQHPLLSSLRQKIRAERQPQWKIHASQSAEQNTELPRPRHQVPQPTKTVSTSSYPSPESNTSITDDALTILQPYSVLIICLFLLLNYVQWYWAYNLVVVGCGAYVLWHLVGIGLYVCYPLFLRWRHQCCERNTGCGLAGPGGRWRVGGPVSTGMYAEMMYDEIDIAGY